MVEIDLSEYFTGPAKLKDLPRYVEKVVAEAGEGNEVVLTGRAPVWLYLCVAHALHGRVIKLVYRSPATGDVTVFDHNPF